jgi:hypothetical protein
MTGSHVERHADGTMTACRAWRPADPRDWNGASNAAKDPMGDDATAPATAMRGETNMAQERAIIRSLGCGERGADGAK